MQAFPCALPYDAVHVCCFCNAAHHGSSLRHYGEQCVCCKACEDQLWGMFEAEPYAYDACFAHTSTSSYSGAKKMKLDQPCSHTLMDEKCKRFYPWVLSQWHQATKAQSATSSGTTDYSAQKSPPY